MADPGLSDLAFQVLDGRSVDKRLRDIGHEFNGEGFSDNAVAFDLWQPPTVEEMDAPEMNHVSDDKVAPLMEVVRKGVAAQKIILQFNDFLISTWNPYPPTDANTDKRDSTTTLRQTPGNVHPCHLMAQEIFKLAREPRDELLSELLNSCERHKCQEYCQKTG
jgi:hypothetical protein